MLAAPLACYHLFSSVIHMGPFNQHFVREIGFIQMLLGAAFVISMIHPATRLCDVGLAQSSSPTSSNRMSTGKVTAGLGGPTASFERALAACVLRQATADLRRFREAKDAVGHEMYSDAFNWFNADDPDWPYSFVNVCQALSVFPKTTRDEVFAHAGSSRYSYSHRVASRVVTSAKAFISGLFAARHTRPLAVAKS